MATHKSKFTQTEYDLILRECARINFGRVRLFALVLFLMNCFLLYRDFTVLRVEGYWERNIGYRHLCTMHVILVVGTALFLLHSFAVERLPESKERLRRLYNATFVWGVLLWCAVLAGWVNQHEHGLITEYVIAIFGIAASYYFPPMQSLVMVVSVQSVFMVAVALMLPEPNASGHYTNTLAMVIIAWLLARTSFHLTAKNIINQEIIRQQAATLAENNTELTLKNARVEATNKEIQRQHEILEEQSAKLELKNTELHESLENLGRTQTQLAQAEKMASLGTLVAGVAHELNTPIGIAVTAASTLHGKVEKFEKEYKEGGLKKSTLESFLDNAKIGADLTLRNLERAANLIQSFKQVAVDQTSDSKRIINLKHYLEGVITSLEPKWKTTQHRVEIECDGTIELETYPGAIAQIITNFVTNSLLHGFDGYTQEGVMRIEAERVGSNVVLKYNDNGRGIPPDILPRIFDPFFTTKQANGGTGLGMHIVYNLAMQKLGGSIRCESELGKGATFIVELPQIT